MKAARYGFTLVEVLTVIAIIMMLVSILLVGVSAVRAGAKKQKARADIATIEHAIKAYQSEYFKLPIPDDPTGTRGQGQSIANNALGEYFTGDFDRPGNIEVTNVIAALMGVDTPLIPNCRRITFLEAQAGATNNSALYLDPWKHPYQIKFDSDYNGKLEYYSGGKNAGSEKIPAAFIVISYGPNGQKDCPLHNPPIPADDAKRQDDIISEVQFNDWIP